MKKKFIFIILFANLLSLFCSCNSNSHDSFVTEESDMKYLTDIPYIEKYDDTSINTSSSLESDSTYYIVTSEERDMLASLVFLESSVCSIDCQKAIVSVVFNRLESGKWRKDVNGDGVITLYDIVYYPNAFSPAYLIENCKGDSNAYEAVDYVIKNGPTVPTEVRYFRANHDFSWNDYANYIVMDNVYFGYFTTWEQGIW